VVVELAKPGLMNTVVALVIRTREIKFTPEERRPTIQSLFPREKIVSLKAVA
jgi:hypothetical protein